MEIAEYEKDFVLRQTKESAKGLSDFLTQATIDEILQMDEKKAEEKRAELL